MQGLALPSPHPGLDAGMSGSQGAAASSSKPLLGAAPAAGVGVGVLCLLIVFAFFFQRHRKRAAARRSHGDVRTGGASPLKLQSNPLLQRQVPLREGEEGGGARSPQMRGWEDEGEEGGKRIMPVAALALHGYFQPDAGARWARGGGGNGISSGSPGRMLAASVQQQQQKQQRAVLQQVRLASPLRSSPSPSIPMGRRGGLAGGNGTVLQRAGLSRKGKASEVDEEEEETTSFEAPPEAGAGASYDNETSESSGDDDDEEEEAGAWGGAGSVSPSVPYPTGRRLASPRQAPLSGSPLLAGGGGGTLLQRSGLSRRSSGSSKLPGGADARPISPLSSVTSFNPLRAKSATTSPATSTLRREGIGAAPSSLTLRGV